MCEIKELSPDHWPKGRDITLRNSRRFTDLVLARDPRVYSCCIVDDIFTEEELGVVLQHSIGNMVLGRFVVVNCAEMTH